MPAVKRNFVDMLLSCDRAQFTSEDTLEDSECESEEESENSRVNELLESWKMKKQLRSAILAFLKEWSDKDGLISLPCDVEDWVDKLIDFIEEIPDKHPWLTYLLRLSPVIGAADSATDKDHKSKNELFAMIHSIERIRECTADRERLYELVGDIIEELEDEGVMQMDEQFESILRFSSSALQRGFLSEMREFDAQKMDHEWTEQWTDHCQFLSELDEKERQRDETRRWDEWFDEVPEVSELVRFRSVRQRAGDACTQAVLSLLRRRTLRERLNRDIHREKQRKSVRELCEWDTRTACDERMKQSGRVCRKLHFNRILRNHSQPAAGMCSYLDGCRHHKTCRFLHYKVDDLELHRMRLMDDRKVKEAELKREVEVKTTWLITDMAVDRVPSDVRGQLISLLLNRDESSDCSSALRWMAQVKQAVSREMRAVRKIGEEEKGEAGPSSLSDGVHPSQYFSLIPRVPSAKLYEFEAQWINCDVRHLDLSILGRNYAVIMADPPWDIHMELSYGTLRDDEMLGLKLGDLSAEVGRGLLFLWVTGRVLETARKCMKRWKYRCVEELVWLKTNQVQRIIRTGRTGHWLNHSKEHCLIGLREGSSDQPWTRTRGLDADAIVAEVRETSRKPSEIYELIERVSPGTRKLEIFGRAHNTRPGWLTLGNQLGSTRILDPAILERFRQRHPDVPVITE